jgi:glycosyltransferase involved in cell wall biosynthesis
LRLAYFSPLPPSPSGISRFSMELLSGLTRRAEVEIFVEDERSLSATKWPVFRHQEFAARDRTRPFDQALYKLGNNRLHWFVYQAALARPGILDLHDALLQHLFLGRSWDAWAEEFAFVYGARGREIAANLRGGDMGAHPGFFRYPLVKRVAEASRAVIVHNPGALERVRREAPGAACHLIPHMFQARPAAADRRALGLSPDAFLAGFFGYVREPRRLPVIVRAFQALRRQVPRTELLIVGDGRAEGPGIRCVGHVSDELFDQYGASCDVVVNLRWPSAGETSGVSIRMMGLGRPVIMTDLAENSAFPADACLRVPPGELEEPLLLEYLLELERQPALGAAIGRNAAAHIAREHSLERCLEMYDAALRGDSASTPAPPPAGACSNP